LFFETVLGLVFLSIERSDMRILQINGYQSPGRRFNGLAITPLLKEQGIHSEHIVWEQDKQEPGVTSINHGWTHKVNRIAAKLEKKLSLQSTLYPHARQIAKQESFIKADVVHLHIIHSGYLSVRSLPWLSRRKPIVWTLHDPWALTGHCIHPGECQRWKIGCGQCPSLDSLFALRTDRTKFLFNQKKKAYSRMTADIVVASDWMLKNVQASPLFQSERIRVHHIPFGIDLEHFNSEESSLSKKQFSIPENNVVLTFRAEGEFKGVPYILEALEKLQVTEPVTLLTVGKKGVVDKYSNKFQVIELGWTNDDSLLAAALKATDIFLMPSTAETFGVMAIEAMECGKPVICFDGTALPGVIDAPNVGISVPMRDADALSHAIAHLIRSPQERLARGVASRQRAETVFSLQTHVQRISDLYREVISRCA
jgi:glycosyltransferase involved in cell wall biosynthesis